MDTEKAKHALAGLECAGMKLLEMSADKNIINPELCRKCPHKTERYFSYNSYIWACELAHIDERLIAKIDEKKVIRQFKVPEQCVFILEHLMYNDNKR